MRNSSKNKIWVCRLLLFFVCLLVLVTGLNYVLDPFGYFRKDLTKQLLEPNQQFLKVRYTTRDNRSFNSFIFGSSRVGHIDVRKIQSGGNWYNMTYSEGLPQEHVKNIEYMLKQGIKIDQLLVGLDEFSYSIDPKIHAGQWSKRPFSPVLGESEIFCYLKYLFHHPDIKVLKTIYDEYRKTHKTKLAGKKTYFSDYDFYVTGQGSNKELDAEIDRDPEKHIRDIKFSEPYRNPYNEVDDFSQSCLESLKKLVALSKANGIKLTIFINPIHKTTYLATNHNKLFAFKRELSKITDFYDFSGLNAITKNNYNYYETSHYRPIIGETILRRILNSGSKYQSFGVLVTSDSVEQHLAMEQKEITALRLHQ